MSQFNVRKQYVTGIFLLIFIILLIKLFIIQVVDTSFKISSENNSQRRILEYPSRGLIYDRNGTLLVSNEIAYDLMVIPRQTRAFDTALLMKDLGISLDEVRLRMKKSAAYSVFKPSVFFKQMTKLQYAYFQEHLYRYPGFYVQNRSLRIYQKTIGAHVLGDIGEIDLPTLETDTFYSMGDYVGKSGVEKYFEKELRGIKGIKIYVVDVHNRIQGSYAQGKYDIPAKAGQDLTLTIDAELQAYGELLMKNKTGSIVVIQPSTGEILAMVSSPGFDPNLLIGRQRGHNFDSLMNAPDKPLFNRAVGAAYPPGSIFKMVQALIALDQGIITLNTSFPCDKSIVGCHNHPPSTDLVHAIQYSCNPYFYMVTRKLIQRGFEKSVFRDSRVGLEIWKNKVLSLGFEQSFDLGLPSVAKGKIPGPDYYDRIYGKFRWAFSTIYSLSIGQGEVLVVPVQMANLAAIIANRGFYYYPHIIKSIGGNPPDSLYLKKIITPFSPDNFIPLVDGMDAVVNQDYGTGGLARIPHIRVCGKTGTAQNPHGEDHSIFIAFAPKDKPEIAVAVYIENAGFGGVWAAPIASLMIEKFMTDTITNKASEERILNSNLLNIADTAR